METQRNIQTAEIAFAEAIVMLKVVERGGSYNAAEWYNRVEKMERFLSPDMLKYVREVTSIDLANTSTKKR